MEPTQATTSARQDARRRAVTALLADDVVRDVAVHLSEPGIGVMPLKGALLQHWLYEDPAARAMSDVDILVRPEHLQVASNLLQSNGYVLQGRSRAGAVELQSPFGLPVDLHPQLFDAARYRLSTYDVFARAALDTDLFGTPVHLPAAIDVYAHLVGKFGSDHLNALAVGRLTEIAKMGPRVNDATVTATHLVQSGMRRVARYVLPLACEVLGDDFAHQVLDHLPPDPVGQRAAKWARSFLSTAAPDSKGGAVVAHLLNDTVPRGVRSGARAAFKRRKTP